MPINANVTNQQITASVSETQIDVSVSGGVGPTGATGPTGPQGPSYTLPVATASILGGVKIGSGVSIDGSGVISVATASVAWSDITGKPATFTPASHTHGNITNAGAIGSTSGQIVVTTTSGVLTTASSISAGAVSGLATVATSGSYADLSGVPSPYTLPTATASVLGGVKIGSGISIDGNGVISASSGYTLPTATASVLGGVKIGSGVTITDGVISVATNYAAASHGHAIADVTGLQTALDGKQASGSYAAAVHTHGISDVTGLQTALDGKQASGSYAAASHGHAIADVTGLQTALDGKASSSHTHSAATDITGLATVATSGSASDLGSGTVPFARLPVGTTSTTVAAGDHTHTQLHDRSHAITSSSDHTATAWRAFYANGSGVITELALGAANTVLTSNGASAAPTFSALPAGGTKTIIRFHPGDNQPPASNFATLDQRNSFLVLEYDAATQESANFIGVIPEGATLTNGLTVRLWWMGDTATSGNVRWGVSFERVGTDNDADSFSSVTEATGTANGTSGIETVTSITATAIDSLVAGDRFRLRVARIAADATNDTMTGDAQLVAVEVQVA